ncbi:MAG: hypothetical protein K940chlam9_00131 [Chlamydiae bacterium]|nr:hypothetical protein [Chlamydiota bacterium]
MPHLIGPTGQPPHFRSTNRPEEKPLLKKDLPVDPTSHKVLLEEGQGGGLTYRAQWLTGGDTTGAAFISGDSSQIGNFIQSIQKAQAHPEL